MVSTAGLPGGQVGACCTGKLGGRFLGEQFEGSVGRRGSEEGRQQSHE